MVAGFKLEFWGNPKKRGDSHPNSPLTWRNSEKMWVGEKSGKITNDFMRDGGGG